MGEGLSVLGFLAAIFCSGILVGHYAARRAYRSEIEAHQNLLAKARDLAKTRRFTGDGITIENVSYWRMGDAGEFEIVMREKPHA